MVHIAKRHINTCNQCTYKLFNAMAQPVLFILTRMKHTRKKVEVI